MYLARAIASGVIVDDEPRVLDATHLVQVPEDGAFEQRVHVLLDRPASTTVSIDYRLEAGTASAGDDFALASGTLVLQSGERVAELLVDVVDDADFENDETLQLILSGPDGIKLPLGVEDELPVTVTIIDNDGPGTMAALNDTLVNTCASETEVDLTCPVR